MSKKIFINIPVKDLPKASAFYESVGFTINPSFSDDTAFCMVLSEEIYVMLLTYTKFKEFTSKQISDTVHNASALFSVSLDSVENVNKMLEKALKAGGKEPMPPKDYGFMQLRGFEDLDGHLWEVFYMDLTKFPQK